VQPTDDGKKIIGTVDVANAGTVLASTVVAESLMKGALEKREAERKLEEKPAAEARARKLADAEREQSQNHASGTATTAVVPVMAQASASKVGQRTYEQGGVPRCGGGWGAEARRQRSVGAAPEGGDGGRPRLCVARQGRDAP